MTLDGENIAIVFQKAVVQMARARIPADISNVFIAPRITGLKKSDGRIRGIATGTAFQKLVATCVAGVVSKNSKHHAHLVNTH